MNGPAGWNYQNQVLWGNVTISTVIADLRNNRKAVMCGHGHEISIFHAFVLQRVKSASQNPEWDISHLGTGGEIFRHGCIMMVVSRRTVG